MNIPLVDLSRQHAVIASDVMEGLSEVIEAGSFIRGPAVAQFEEAFAKFCGASHCVGVASGTDAIELAARALGLGPGDVVVVPANSFIASALGLIRAGIGIRLVDCDPQNYLIDVEAVADVIGGTSGVLPVHLYGQMADMAGIRSVAGDRAVIEDAAQSQGAAQGPFLAGSVGDVSATSFYPGKNLGAFGDAGAVLTDDVAIAEKVRALGNWGSDVKYHHPILGSNSRLDSLQAVVLSVKLAHLDEWNAQRREAAGRYHELLVDIGDITLPTVAEGNQAVWHLYVVEVDERDEVLAQLHGDGVGAGIHYPTPMHLQPALAELGYGPGSFPVAERAAGRVLSLPLFPGITENEQQYVAESLIRAVRG